MPHWWLSCMLENKKMVHIDLCALAYGISDSVDGILDITTMRKTGRAPVFMFEVEDCYLGDVPEKPHKFLLTNKKKRNNGIHVPPPIRHLQALAIGITPIEGFGNWRFNQLDKRVQQLHLSAVSHFVSILSDTHKPDMKEVRQYLSLDDMTKEIVQRISQEIFTPNCYVEIHSLTSDKGKLLNGKKGQIIKNLKLGNSFQEVRWWVKLDSGEEVSVCHNNLIPSIEKSPSIEKTVDSLKNDSSFLEMANDPKFHEFMMLLRNGNSGFTTLTRPDFLPYFKKLIEAGILPLSKEYELALSIADNPKGEAFRLFIMKCNNDGLEFLTGMQDPFFKESYEKLRAVGFFKARG